MLLYFEYITYRSRSYLMLVQKA